MKELVFPHLHKPIELINNLLTKINKNLLLQKGMFGAIIGTIGAGVVLTTLGTVLGVFSGGLKTNAKGVKSSAPAQFVINYNPTINCSGNTTKDEFTQMLKKHKDEILGIFRNEADRKLRVAY